ncbi:nicotinate-nucleotide--dimethylbenzimidazole phosphoribosyltransferase [Caproiciproducens faecalis]|uniref:Nicotinate-nucleotide--dimethylbenzimidazole phosphoribosyltransferase n=1 Tax=Caproiciproducens faecalis TaxID=2820301 RepID=A0ABS7DIZ8_9FIRM|nr:nicotinate-nucleotide--dimethylbenzimidazole phosphoribosyltransferase [Caproiciproducens faecalis]MBW7571275.1 nicotinate-nucleotide--dimethylbenzimidazole phosphoribosyltransferase [Caproiciproducens faecalis]
MTKEALTKLKIDKPNEAARQRVKKIWDGIAKPLDGLGQFETIVAQIGAITGTAQIDLSKKAVIVMCADNGIVEEQVSQCGQEVTAVVASSMVRGNTSVCKMAKRAGADVIAVDIGINRKEEIPGLIQKKIARGTKNFLKEPAMSEAEALQAIAAGMEIAEKCGRQGYRILATGEMGIGNTTTSSAMAAALLQCDAEEITGKGAGLSREKLAHKREVVSRALDRYCFKKDEALRILASVGGYDIAGLTGVFIGGAICHIPVVIDGVISAVAALTAERLVPGVKDYIIPSHISREPAAKKIFEELGVHPVIDAGLALGEGTGAVMMFTLLDTALAVYENQTTFDDISTEQYVRFE